MTIYHHETLSVNKKYERIKTAPMKEKFPEMSRGNFYGVAILKCDVKLLLGVSTLLFKLQIADFLNRAHDRKI